MMPTPMLAAYVLLYLVPIFAIVYMMVGVPFQVHYMESGVRETSHLKAEESDLESAQ